MKKVLFLCTGNTCRSPMAACLFDQLCREQGLPFSSRSAGLHAREGAPASDGAYAAMQAQGLSLRGHRATPITQALAQGADLILAMTAEHAALLHQRFPGLTTPVRVFSPSIPDPFGGDLQAYRETAQALQRQLSPLAQELQAFFGPN